MEGASEAEDETRVGLWVSADAGLWVPGVRDTIPSTVYMFKFFPSKN